ncbi:MAG: hypothetical protein H0U44_08230 [Flavisolibacter sp.]|nr:hypothetical protein [Flavisolibacter sp.]
MKNLVAFLLILSLTARANAQRVVDVDKENVSAAQFFNSVAGEPVVMAKFVKLVEGSPFYKNEWLVGEIELESGQIFKNLSLKINLYDDDVHYKDDKDREMIATMPIRTIRMRNVMGDTIEFAYAKTEVQKGLERGWYHVLHLDSVTLYKKYKKEISEDKPYGSATTEQRMRTREVFYVGFKGAFTEIKKITDPIPAFAAHKTAIAEFMKSLSHQSHELKLVALVQYMNRLIK